MKKEYCAVVRVIEYFLNCAILTRLLSVIPILVRKAPEYGRISKLFNALKCRLGIFTLGKTEKFRHFSASIDKAVMRWYNIILEYTLVCACVCAHNILKYIVNKKGE